MTRGGTPFFDGDEHAPVRPRYCSDCGSPLDPGDAFCAQCGASVDRGSSDAHADRDERRRDRAGVDHDRRRRDRAGFERDRDNDRRDREAADHDRGGVGRGAFDRDNGERDRDGFGRDRDGFGRDRDGFGRDRDGFGRDRDGFDRDRERSGRDRESSRRNDEGWRAGRVSGRRDLRDRVNRLVAAGWTVERDDGDSVVLVDRGIGSLPAHVVLFFVTGGVGNALYGAYRLTAGAPRRALSTDTVDRPTDETTEFTRLLPLTLAGVIAVVGVLSAASSAATGNPVLGVIGLTLTVAITGVLLYAGDVGPPSDPTRFGRHRTVERERVETPAEPCVSCGDPAPRGERRRYTDRTYLAGVPIRTHEAGTNVYCVDCLHETGWDPASSEPESEREREREREPTG